MSDPSPPSVAISATNAPPQGTITADSPEISALASKFYTFARNGTVEPFEQAIPRGLPINLTNDAGDTLLMLASYHGHRALAEYLLDHGADPNRLNDRGQSILAGCVFKNHVDLITLLLARGADPDLGAPSALQAVSIFRMNEGDGKAEWVGEMERAAERIRATKAMNGHETTGQ